MSKYIPTDQDIDFHLNRIHQSIIDDVGGILNVYSSNRIGFFAIPRLLFPEIDGLGSYFTGKPRETAENIITYFRVVVSKIDTRYAKYAVFITLVYRHGLLHQHDPKVFEYRKKDVGWMIMISNPNNPPEIRRKEHLEFSYYALQIDMNLFYLDILNSISLAKELIKKEYRNQYISTFNKQHSPLNKTKILNIVKYKSFVSKKDFDFFKEFNS